VEERPNAMGRRIREARSKLGLTQEQLGERANLHYSYIGQVERGAKVPSLRTLKRIAEALNVDLETLLEDRAGYELPTEDLLIRELVAIVKSSPPEEIRFFINLIRMVQQYKRGATPKKV